MAKSVLLEVITPSKLFYMGTVEMVIARTLQGDEGFMADHSWACKLLDVGELWIQEEGSKDYKIAAVAGGYIDVKENIVIFTDAAEWPDDIDLDRAMNEKERAENWLKMHEKPADNDDEHSLYVAQAQLAIAKAMTRMGVKGGGTRRKR
ncbi:MAG: F0F1 ATP synthase subunit epsilon [Anaerovorax sp.]